MIYIYIHNNNNKMARLKYDGEGKLIIPSLEYLAEVSDFLQDLFEVVISTQDTKLLAIYNKTALAYNAKANHNSFINFQNPLQMAQAKKAVAKKEVAAAPVETPKTKTAATKKVAATAEDALEKPPSQKQTVIEYASAPHFMTIDQIVEKFGYKKTNVAWYFSKHKLHQPKEPKTPEPAVPAKAAKATKAAK